MRRATAPLFVWERVLTWNRLRGFTASEVYLYRRSHWTSTSGIRWFIMTWMQKYRCLSSDCGSKTDRSQGMSATRASRAGLCTHVPSVLWTHDPSCLVGARSREPRYALLQEEVVRIVGLQQVGKCLFWEVRVGQTLRLPLSCRRWQCFTRSVSQDCEVWSVLSTTSDVENTRPEGSGSPSTTHQWCLWGLGADV